MKACGHAGRQTRVVPDQAFVRSSRGPVRCWSSGAMDAAAGGRRLSATDATAGEAASLMDRRREDSTDLLNASSSTTPVLAHGTPPISPQQAVPELVIDDLGHAHAHLHHLPVAESFCESPTVGAESLASSSMRGANALGYSGTVIELDGTTSTRPHVIDCDSDGEDDTAERWLTFGGQQSFVRMQRNASGRHRMSRLHSSTGFPRRDGSMVRLMAPTDTQVQLELLAAREDAARKDIEVDALHAYLGVSLELAAAAQGAWARVCEAPRADAPAAVAPRRTAVLSKAKKARVLNLVERILEVSSEGVGEVRPGRRARQSSP